MTARQRRIYWRKERNKADRYIKRYRRLFEQVFRSEYNRFADEVERGNGQGYANTYLSSQAIFNALQTIYRTVGPMYARRAFNSRERQKNLFTPDFWIDAILQYLGDNFYNRGLLKITETTRKHFLDILNQGFREGWSPLRTAEYIREDPAIDSVIRLRAEMIARTETGRAIHSGTFVGADKSPFVKVKEWISAKDSRTRRNPENKPKGADHWRLDGQVVEFSEQFTDPSTGTKLEHPHDPKARAVEVVNCRCTYAVLNKVDKDGKLIRKPGNGSLPFTPTLPTVRPVTPPPVVQRPAAQPQQRPQAGVFKPANNIDEIKPQLKNIFEAKTEIKVKDITFAKNMPVELANKYGKTVFSLVNEYKTVPLSDAASTQINFVSTGNNYGKVTNIIAGKRAAILEINFGSATDKDRGTQVRAELDKYNFVKLSTKSKVDASNSEMATAVHEYAHFIATDRTGGFATGRTASAVVYTNPEMNNSQAFFKELKSLKLKYTKEMNAAIKGKNIPELNNISLGQYASTNLNEFMAEGFTEYKLNSNPSKYAKLVGQLIDKYFKR